MLISITGKLIKWLQTSLNIGPHHFPPHEQEEWQRLQGEVEALQQQVHSIKQQKGADIVRLQVKAKERTAFHCKKNLELLLTYCIISSNSYILA